ncbi:MAG TPA: hypothetical protein VFP84_04895 [Kofleriaceae bacterium]|nr:hypothetical protein [Kofleriaceae bacterium]
MTVKPRIVRALRDARTRMRDAAAADHSVTTAARERAEQQLADEQRALEAALDAAAGRLAGARTVWEVHHVAEGTGVHRLAVLDAAARHHQAVHASNATAAKLHERTRQLKTAERLVDMVEDVRAKREATAEQKSADDMAGARRK